MAALVGKIFYGVVKRQECYALLLGVAHLLHSRRHLGLAAAVDDVYLLGTHAARRAAGVHGSIAAADDGHALSAYHRGGPPLASGAHQIHAGKIFIARHHAHAILAGNPHEARKPGSGGHENAPEAAGKQVVVADGLAHHAVGHELDAHLLESANLNVDNLVGEAEFRDTVFQYAADLMQSLVDMYLESAFCHVAGKGKRCRTGAHYCHFYTICSLARGQCGISAQSLGVGGETLKITYRHGRPLHLVVDALRLALAFLGTNAAAHGRQGARLLEHNRGVVEIFALDILDESRNIDAYGAAGDTRRIRAVEAARCLQNSLVARQALVHLLVAGNAVGRIEFSHFHARNGCTLFGSVAFAQLLTPLGVAGRYGS